MVRTLAAAALCLVAACGSQSEPQVATAPTPSSITPSETTEAPPKKGPRIMGPPPFRLRYDGQELQLRPFTWCYESACADGFSSDPPNIGSPTEVEVYVPVEEFRLNVGFHETAKCGGRGQRADVEPLGDGWYRVVPHGHEGRYRVTLHARGGGDMMADFLWDTPSDGPLAEPSALLYDMNDYSGETRSDAFELFITNLARTPDTVSALITITAANGRAVEFEATRSKSRCSSAGSVSFHGPDDRAAAAVRLGDAPFLHRVVLTIDGVEHVATATYPDDQVDDGDVHGMPLEFEPPLPGLGE